MDVVRGIASLMVCLFHLIHHLPHDSILREPTRHWGVIGVFMFFVVSGFVVPLSLGRLKPVYKIASFPIYMARRIVRLDPPYFVSIVLAMTVVGLANLVPGYRGQVFSIDPIQLLLHVGYLNGIFGYSWVNGVYWTLSLEFQFYILIGLVYPVLASQRPATWRVAFWLLCVAEFLPTLRVFQGNGYSVLIYDYMSIFLMGVAAWHRLKLRMSNWEYLASLVVLASVSGFGLTSVVGMATSLFIVTANMSPGNILQFLSNISYSLYLTHVPVGRSLVHLLRRISPDSLVSDAMIIMSSTAVCFLVAYVMYLCVELPSLRVARSMREGGVVKERSDGVSETKNEESAYVVG